MKKTALFTLCLSILLSFAVSASLGDGSQRVFDDYGLFTDSESASLEDTVSSMKADYGYDFVVLTADVDTNGLSQDYADDFLDENGFSSDSALVFIDMFNRCLTISTTGIMRRYLTDDRIDELFDYSVPYLSDGDYYGGVNCALSYISGYINAGIPEDQYNYDTDTGEIDYYEGLTKWETFCVAARRSLPVILIDIVIGFFVGFGYYRSVKKKYGLKESTYRYDVNKNTVVELSEKIDNYIRSDVVRTPKAPPPDSGGNNGGGSRSSVHVSFGGVSHGGGSRGF